MKQKAHQGTSHTERPFKTRLVLAGMAVSLCLGGVAYGDEEILKEVVGEIQYTYTVTNGEATITGLHNINSVYYYVPVGGDVEFPETLGGYPVVALKANTLYDADAFTSLKFPDSFRTIESGNFRYTESMTNMTFGTGLRDFVPFAQRDVFQTFTVPEGNPYFSAEGPILYSKDKKTLVMCGANVTEFTVPSGVTAIGPSAFSEMKSLTNVTFHSGVREIGDYAFDECRNLATAALPANLQVLGPAAFNNCHSLTGAAIPGTVAKIGDSAFSWCSALKSLAIAEGVKSIGNSAFNGCQELTKVVVPNSVTNISGWAFDYCTKLRDVTIGSGVVQIGDPQEWYIDEWDGREYLSDPSPSFGDCDSLLNFKLADGNTVYEEIGGCLFFRDTPKYSKTLAVYPSGRTDFYFTGDVNVTTIAPAACAHCGKLEDIVITNSIREIGVQGFTCCSSLRKVLIPNGPTNIAEGAFQMNMQLADVEIAGTVKKIGDFAFMHGYMPDDPVIGRLILHEGIEEIGDGIINRTRDLYDLVVPDSVTKIGDSAFSDSENLTRLTLGSGVTEIPSGLCAYDQALKRVTIRGKVKRIGDWAFDYCEKLESINLPDSLEFIGHGAFSSCSLLSYVSISAATIDSEAFEDCKSLVRVDFADSVRTIGTNAFCNCYALQNVIIPEGIETIEPLAFKYCGIETAYLPQKLEGTIDMTSGWSIFYGCPLDAEDIIYYGSEGPAQVSVTYMSQGKTVETRKYLVNSLDYQPTVTADGLAFVGWYTAEEGGHLLTDEDLTEDITVYARWIESPFIDTGAQEWNPAEDEAFPGEIVWRTADLTGGGAASASYAVAGPAVVSFHWMQTSDNSDDYLTVYIDGEEADFTQSEEWTKVTLQVPESGSHVVTWTYKRNRWSDDPFTASASIADIRVVSGTAKTITFDVNGGTLEEDWDTTRKVVTVLGDLPFANKDGVAFAGWWTELEGGERVTAATKPEGDATYYAHWVELPFTVSGFGTFWLAEDGSWATLPDGDHYGRTAKASVTLKGPCMVSFEWRHAASRYSTSTFKVDGVEKTWLENDTGWCSYSWSCDDTEEHVIEWEFFYGYTSRFGQMCLRNISMGTPYDITFDPNDDYPPSVEKRAGKLGTLPVPNRFAYVTFDGWYTAAEGGERVTSETPVTGPATYYGRWVESPVVTYWGNLWLFEPDGSLVSDNACNEYNPSIAEKELRGAPGTLMFRWRMQSDSGSGDFKFLVTDDSLSGFVETNCLTKSSDEWVTERYVFTKETSVRWSYNVGADRGGIERGWIKDVTWTTGVVDTVEWTVTFDANGGELKGDAEKTVVDNFPVGKTPVATKADYGFLGWFTEAEGGDEVTEETPVIADMTVYAHWKHIDSQPPEPPEPEVTSWTIAFNANGGEGAMEDLTLEQDESKKLTENAFTRTGYTFKNWNTEPDGSGTAYSDKKTVKNLLLENGATMTLYAQWSPITYTVKFNGNGSTSGSMSAMSRTYDDKKALTANAFKKTDYVFRGWATSKSGSVKYTNKEAANLSSKNAATVTLYAVWEIIKYNVAFDGNGATSGTMDVLTLKVGESKALTANAFKRTGYTFQGWAKDAAATKVAYKNKALVKNLSSKDGATVKLYALWAANKYTVKFNANGGTGTMKALSATYDKKVTLTANKFKRTNWTFLGWATKKDATEVKYTNKAKVKNLSSKSGGTVTLYALWKRNTYTVKFSANGGTGDAQTQTLNCGDKTALGKNVYKRPGFTFAGWATAKDGSVVYKNKASVKDLAKSGESLTLYAVWKPAAWAVGTFNGAGHYLVDAWGEYESYDFVHTATVGTYGKLSGSVTVDVHSGVQEKASFSASSAKMMYSENVHLDFWHDWDSEQGWIVGCTYDGPAYYYDVAITLHGVKKTRRIWICDLVNGEERDNEEGERLTGVSLAVFSHLDKDKGEAFEGEGAVNLWKSKAYSGPLPTFSAASIQKKVTTEDGDVCTFTFKKDGSATVKITRANKKTDSASFTMEARPQDDGKWFTVEGNWIFPKGSIAYVEFKMTPNSKGVIAEKNIKVLDIEVDIDD